MLSLVVLLATAVSPDPRLQRGDALATQGDWDGAIALYAKAFADELRRIRGRPFKKRVVPQRMDRAALRRRVLEVLEREVPRERLDAQALVYALFGFAAAPPPLHDLLAELYAADIAGFYDTTRKELVVVADAASDAEEQKSVLLHEMVHALADQYVDIEQLHVATTDNDDAQLALTALIEGDATLAMIASLEGVGQAVAAPATLAKYFELFNDFVPSTGVFSRAPKVVQAGVTFPYREGTVFAAHAFRDGGWPRVDGAYLEPPRSTEQILYPEKYFTERDDPVSVVCAGLPPSGWRAVQQGTLGQLQLAVLLGIDARAAEVAGWGGDRYVAFEREGQQALVWLSVWDSAADAREFAAQYAAFVWAKHTGRGLVQHIAADRGLQLHVGAAEVVIRVTGQHVWSSEGFDARTTERLLRAPICATPGLPPRN